MNKNIRINIHEVIFVVCYIFLLLSVLFERVYFIRNYLNYFEYFSISILFLNYITDLKFTRKNLFVFLIISIFVGISTIITKNLVLMKMILLLLGSKSIEFKKILKIDVIIRTILVILVLIFHFNGMTNDYLTLRDGILRNSMGFAHPNIFGLNILIINMEILYISKRKFNLKIFLINIISLAVIMNFSYSRTCAYILILVLIFYYLSLVKEIKIDNNLLKNIIIRLFIIITFITYIFTLMYRNNSEIGIKINNFLSSRIYCINSLLEQYGISILGKNIPFISTELAKIQGVNPIVLDNAYFHILIRYGVIVYCIFYYMFKKILTDMINNKDVVGVVIVVSFLIYGISETFMFNISYNTFLYYFTTILFIRKKEVKKDE